MKFLCFAVSVLLATPVFANGWCDELWFTRNLVMDRAGYCFGSQLGQTYFDNSNCIGKSVTPARHEASLVSRIQALEAESGCRGRVNTAGSYLNVQDIGIRLMLDDLPIVAEMPRACLGWRGPVTTLHAGKRPSPNAFGLIEPGDTISFDHEPEAGWIYVTAYSVAGEQAPWNLKSGGWISVGQVQNAPCDSYLP